MFGIKNEETIEQKVARLNTARTDLATMHARLNELNTTKIATRNYDGDVIGAMRAQRVRDSKVAALMAEQDQLNEQIRTLLVEIKAGAPTCNVCGSRFSSQASLKKHKAEARSIQNPQLCGNLV